jgi:hypothetical protein
MPLVVVPVIDPSMIAYDDPETRMVAIERRDPR